jgi:hypothetical protein
MSSPAAKSTKSRGSIAIGFSPGNSDQRCASGAEWPVLAGVVVLWRAHSWHIEAQRLVLFERGSLVEGIGDPRAGAPALHEKKLHLVPPAA